MLQWFKTALHRAKKGIAASLTVWLSLYTASSIFCNWEKTAAISKRPAKKRKNSMQYFWFSPMLQPILEKRRKRQGEASIAREGLDTGQV